MRYLRDLPLLRAGFAKIDPKHYPEMIKKVEDAATGTEGDPIANAAWAAYIREYGIDDPRPLSTLAAYDLKEAMARAPLPRWALSLLTKQDFTQIKEVKKQ